MGAQRSAQTPPQQQEADAQAAIAAALVGSVGLSQTAFVAAIAPLLLPLMPASLLARPGEAAEVAEGVTRLLYRADAVPVPSAGFGRTAAMEAISYRAAYAKEAVRRLSGAVLRAVAGRRGEVLARALEAEKRHLSAHLEQTRRRLAAAKVVDGLIELHGPILGWKHAEKGIPEDPRPNHVAADRKNFDTRRGIPVLTGALPGVLPFCTCGAVAPYPNAEMIV